MILVIDTSSSRSALSFIDSPNGRRWDVIFGSRETGPPLDARLREEVADVHQISRVVIATGPGSFTGLRRGASFGIGLAMGLGVPVVPLPTLDLQAARGAGHLTAVAEAGRGRFYYLMPGDRPALGAADEIPRDHQLVGLLSTVSRATLEEHGHRLAADEEVQTVAEAAEGLLKSAHEVPYGSVKLEYMQSFGARF